MLHCDESLAYEPRQRRAVRATPPSILPPATRGKAPDEEAIGKPRLIANETVQEDCCFIGIEEGRLRNHQNPVMPNLTSDAPFM